MVRKLSKVFFPNQVVALIRRTPGPASTLQANQVAFRVQPDMTKLELKDYLDKVYGINALSVNTMNYAGKYKRDWRRRTYKTPAWKKAVVTLDHEPGDYFFRPQQ